ncbi:MAG: DUF1186 domain-containing protein [Hyphomicrobiaceae bacterium]
MDEHSILMAFSQSDGLPRAALRAAAIDRTRLVPRFIALMEEFLTLPPAERPKQTPFFFIFHLLGDWREKAAYRTLAKILRLPDEHLGPILGDAVTSTVNRVMVQVFDGDPEPLFDVIRDKHADEFVRSRMCDALVTLVLQGNLDRTRAEVFLRDCFSNLQPQATNYVWVGWMEAVARLGLEAYSGIVETAFKRQYIDPGVCGYKHFLEDLSRAATEEGRAMWLADDDLKPFGDTVDELSRWHCFNEERRKRVPRHQAQPRPSTGWLDNSRRNQPIRSTKVGRNVSCPCGSGKKFKKCCAA